MTNIAKIAQKSNSKVFLYQEQPITFELGSNLMVNATEMAKSFGKQPSDWTRLKQSNDYIVSLSAVRGICGTELIKVMRGGNNLQGTWMHEDVALEFARWLSPEFAIWCNDRIKELMKYGATMTEPTIDAILSDPDLIIGLAQQLKTERAEKELLQEQNELNKKQIRAAAPKVNYFDEVMSSESVYNTNRIAKEHGMSAISLNRKLQEMGVQYNQGGQWLLVHEHQNKGYTKTRTYTFMRSDGSTGTSLQTVWTEKGRHFIHELLQKEAV